VVSVQTASSIILNSARPMGCEYVSLLAAFDRVLYDNVVSDRMIPPQDQSAMDGYAIIASDTKGASRSSPVRIKVVGDIQAGSTIAGNRIEKGTAVRIVTGAPTPEGADSVMQVEETEERDGYVTIFCEASKFKNYRRAGESIRKGDHVLSKGHRLGSADVGLLSALNYSVVRVHRRPTVSIFSTGDELARDGEEIGFGQIRDMNAYSLYSEVLKYGAIPEYLGIAKDALEDVKDMFSKAMTSDAVISTGGVSKGNNDFVKQALYDVGIETLFEMVHVKPGTPCVFGRKGDKLFFSLPGNPVSSLVSFIQFVRPALLRLMGSTNLHKPIIDAILEEDIQSGHIHHIIRGRFSIRNREMYVKTTGNQKPSVLRSMSLANCLIIIPEGIANVKAGERVAIQLIDHHEI
jgi:molybdopterin molybdotransferase